jgi:hypothetical protein
MRVLPPADVMATLAVAVIPADTMAADAASRLAIGNADSDDQDRGESKNRWLQVAHGTPTFVATQSSASLTFSRRGKFLEVWLHELPPFRFCAAILIANLTVRRTPKAISPIFNGID